MLEEMELQEILSIREDYGTVEECYKHINAMMDAHQW